MAAVNASRSMGIFKGFCTTKATALDELLTSLVDSTPTPDEVSEVKKLQAQLSEQFDRMHAKWEVYAEAITDDTVFTKCEKDYTDSEVMVTRQIKAAKAFLKEAPTDAAVQPNTAGTASTKIDELLKPK